MSFTFGQTPGTSGQSSGGLFGTSGTSGQTTGGLFGTSGANNSGSTGGSVFGSTGATGGASNPGTGWSFGQNANTQNTGSSGSTSGGFFGQASNTQNTASTGNTSGGMFSKPSNPQNTGSAGSTSGGLFGGGSTGGSIFANTNNTGSSSSSQAPGTPGQPATSKPPLFGSTTPATSGGSNFFGNPSTTPAGQPPTNSMFGASTGGATSQSQTAPTNTFSFGAKQPAPTSSGTSTTPAQTSGMFGGQQPSGGGLFAQKTDSTPAPSGGGLFSQKPANETSGSASGGGLFGAKPSASNNTPAAGSSNPFGGFSLGGGGGKNGQSDASKPPENNQSSTSAGGGFSFFTKKDDKPAESTPKPDAPKAFNFPSQAASAAPDQPTSSQPAASSIFTSTNTSAPSSGGFQFAKPTAPASQTNEKPKTGGFQFPSSGQSSTSTSQPSTTATASTGLFNLGGGASQSQGSSAATTTAPAPASAPTSGLFSNLGGGATSAAPANAASTTSAIKGANTLTASTAGPPATAQSRLRNKTMDEILTRWASDLTRYTKEFKAHAETIAHWDQIIVDNSAKIDKLYVKTRTCEKQTMSVEMQLTAVENQQNELEAWLNKYENDVDEMLAKDGPAQNELGGPDQERERTYKLAERLGERLDDMGRDLQSMIEEVNAANASLGKSSKADEPITQIVKILNSHLSQLQAIDQGTSALQSKVAAAQKAASGMNYMNGGISGDNRAAVDDFYRSYIGRR
ncbi:FG-nucleoporin nsp1 [Exophiala xenobiotica]|uniref:FG-nucleoporin nsp1 n=1 Tax=Lithohypha guttulata TaxID=1690604 RepID=A0ABR0JWA9_9EURO|nr:FG-nucleoporin nsp1 [Lithohypha guttulata]KAK5323751.1 FG-nucleoporin nsp1 [Exophiala xenobiotica]